MEDIVLIGGPCPKCGSHIDQPRDREGVLMFSYQGKPANWCPVQSCGVHLLWIENKGWVER